MPKEKNKMCKWEQDFYGNDVMITSRENDSVTYRISDETGGAVLTRYEVYKGISLIYNDVHMPYIQINETNNYSNVMEINHCREGKIEFESIEGDYLYVKKGDMAINTKADVKNFSNFPLSHYHGVTIEIDLNEVKKNPVQLLLDMGIDLDNLYQMFYRKNRPIVLHEKKEFEHLFAELYLVPDKIRIQYYKLKVAEILLFLSVLDVRQEKVEKRYFNKDIVAHVKEAHEYMTTHISEKMTIEALAEKFHTSPTRLKKCFREVYGNSIYAYLKEFRIKCAVELLRESNMEIGKIASFVGYDNASKFSESFKSIMGINPRDYRKSICIK